MFYEKDDPFPARAHARGSVDRPIVSPPILLVPFTLQAIWIIRLFCYSYANLSNQSMKPTAPWRSSFRVFATTPRLWLIFFLDWMRSRLRGKSTSPGIAYLTVTALALMVITLTGHLGGILSGVETP